MSIVPLQNQVAGHFDTKLIMSGNDKIYKPLQSGSRGDRESQFYENLLNIPHFAEFVPKFYGVETIQDNGSETSYLVLEDLTAGIPHESLCIADIKMGTRTYDDSASEKKILHEKTKSEGTSTVTHGLRICGMRVYEGEERGIQKYDRSWGKKLNAETLPIAIKTFVQRKVHLIPSIIAQLKDLLVWFENNYNLAFYGTSILIVFNGAEVSGADIDQVKVKIIDFAHVCDISDPSKRDEGYIFGLQNLIKLFESVL